MGLKLPLILDGATGTQMQKRGFKGDVASEQWALEHPEAIREIEEGYINAGSDVIYAPTFAANRIKMAEHRITESVHDFNGMIVAMAKENAAGRALVAGDMSPSGQFLEPMGDISFEELVDVYREQAEGLEDAGVDLYVIETMMTVADARAAVLGIRSVSEKPILVTFTCDEHGRCLNGSDICAVLQIMQGMEIDAFGMNCSVGMKEMKGQIKRMKRYATVPLIVKANAGLPIVVNGETTYDCPPDEFTAYMDELLADGAAIFGGCCGTGPEHIAAIREKLEGKTPAAPAGSADFLPAATETEVFDLPLDTVCNEEPVACDDDLEDNLDEALEEDDDTVAILLNEDSDLDCLIECQYTISKPVFFVCNDAELLESALRIYQGRALYAGGLSEEELEPLVRRYGLICP